jgi:YD repeat-containing protein
MPSGFSPSGRLKEQYVYDRVGNLLSSTDPNGHQTQTEYDGLNRPKRIVDALGREKQILYDDPEGSHVHKSRETDLPRGLSTSYAYDPLGRETLRTVRLEGRGRRSCHGVVSYPTATQYVDDEHALLVTDARETVTRVELDGLDREVRRLADVGGLNLETRTAYDGGGNKTSVFDPRSNESRWSYDVLGRLISATDAQLKTASFAYDGEGLKLSETDRRNVTTLHTYDNLGRPRTSRLSSSPFSGVGWTHETTYRDQVSPRQRVETDANSRPPRSTSTAWAAW